jgi:hypothetical protein
VDMCKQRSIVKKMPLVPLVLLLTALPAIASSVQGPAAVQPTQPNSALIQRLEAAKNADWNAAQDPSISTVRQETYLNQMNKSDRVIKELTHGFAVSQAKVDDALWTPPRHITAEERASLIEQLREARRQDERNEQQMLNDAAWSNSRGPADTAVFDQRKAQIDSVLKNLEIEAPVHWSDIHQALVVVSPS